MTPRAPAGGGYLVLTKNQLAKDELMRLIRAHYPDTKIIASQPIPATPKSAPHRG